MRGGPFSSNLRRMLARQSDGGAGGEHAQATIEAERENLAVYARPSLRQRCWRKLGFRYHLGEEPEGTEEMIGWMRTDSRIHFGWADRLRLLVSGTLKFSTIVHHDTPSASVCKTRLDWQIVPPGDRS